MLDHQLNPRKTKRFRYAFDAQLISPLAPTLKKTLNRMLIFMVLGLLGLSWVPIQRTLNASKKDLHRAKQEVFFNRLQAKRQAVQKLHRIISAYETGLDPSSQWQLAALINELGQEYQLDPYFILAVIRTESFFYNDARSIADARGLMQILPGVGAELSAQLGIPYQPNATLFNPLANVQLGTFFLAELIKRFKGNVEQALLGYNRGPNGVQKALAQGDEVPSHYARRVFDNYERLNWMRKRPLESVSLEVATPAILARVN